MPLEFKLDINSSRTYENIQLAQKYVLDEHLSYNIKSLKKAGEDAAPQNFH